MNRRSAIGGMIGGLLGSVGIGKAKAKEDLVFNAVPLGEILPDDGKPGDYFCAWVGSDGHIKTEQKHVSEGHSGLSMEEYPSHFFDYIRDRQRAVTEASHAK